MYRKQNEGWLKHIDFIILDFIAVVGALILAWLIRTGEFNYSEKIVQHSIVLYVLSYCVITVFTSNFKGVLKRGYGKELHKVFENALLVSMLAMCGLFAIQEGEEQSRLVVAYTFVLYMCIAYVFRIGLKAYNRHHKAGENRSLLIVTTSERAKKTAQKIDKLFKGFSVLGIVIIDDNTADNNFNGIPVVTNIDSISYYVMNNWVDEVLFDLNTLDLALSNLKIEQIQSDLYAQGVRCHIRLFDNDIENERKMAVDVVGPYVTLSISRRVLTSSEYAIKRVIDIIGGLVGSVFTLILTIFIGTAIYISDPGPVFFTQDRVGKNGKLFKIYKFRSMYKDAEERKAALMDQNQVGSSQMFKMKDDPRIIKGIGHFIRDTSLDEFPQFFNVLKGEMSLVGTRPPLPKEVEAYEKHHRVRLSARPGITGMWQVSGRSEITDFDEVVKLDQKYIDNWSIWLDIKIILKTIGVVLKREGSM